MRCAVVCVVVYEYRNGTLTDSDCAKSGVGSWFVVLCSRTV